MPLEDLKLLERLIEEREERLDVEAARAVLAESADHIPYADVRRRIGLDDCKKSGVSPDLLARNCAKR
jgi:hypothetical protein